MGVGVYQFPESWPLNVYNQDRSLLGRITNNQPAHSALKAVIKEKGFCLFKAYYRVKKLPGGRFKVNPSRMVEIQPW